MKLMFQSIFEQQMCSNINKNRQSCIPGMTATILYAIVTATVSIIYIILN